MNDLVVSIPFNPFIFLRFSSLVVFIIVDDLALTGGEIQNGRLGCNKDELWSIDW